MQRRKREGLDLTLWEVYKRRNTSQTVGGEGMSEDDKNTAKGCPAVKSGVQSESHPSSVKELKAFSFGATSPGALLPSPRSSSVLNSSYTNSPPNFNITSPRLELRSDNSQCTLSSPGGLRDVSEGSIQVSSVSKGSSGVVQSTLDSQSSSNIIREGPIFQSTKDLQKNWEDGFLKRYRIIVGSSRPAMNYDLNTATRVTTLTGTGTEEEQQVAAEAQSTVKMEQLNLSDDEICQNERNICPSGLNSKTGEISTEQIVNNPRKATLSYGVSLLRPKERTNACSGKEPLLKDGISTSDLNFTSIRKETVKSPIARSVTPGNASEDSGGVSRENAGVQDTAPQKTGNTAVLAGSSGEGIKMYKENHYLKSAPIPKLVRLVALSPAVEDLIEADSLDLVVGFCWSGCLRMSCFSELLWKTESPGVSQPYCRYCCTKGLQPTQMDFWFVGKVRGVTASDTGTEDMEVIFSSRFAAKYLGCSVSEYVRNARRRRKVHNKLDKLQEKPFELLYILVQTPQGKHYRAV